ncbi:unnamed protein product [Protopolystoma xenopodis]|uniref:Uncharacterized protein n=1 Tax=Protopolystoma xenopodis TaxID=117903 RepID=A0A3S5BQF1_9PLAT|nr:unnamed protein product [Protopolystoma xenopodis]
MSRLWRVEYTRPVVSTAACQPDGQFVYYRPVVGPADSTSDAPSLLPSDLDVEGMAAFCFGQMERLVGRTSRLETHPTSLLSTDQPHSPALLPPPPLAPLTPSSPLPPLPSLPQLVPPSHTTSPFGHSHPSALLQPTPPLSPSTLLPLLPQHTQQQQQQQQQPQQQQPQQQQQPARQELMMPSQSCFGHNNSVQVEHSVHLLCQLRQALFAFEALTRQPYNCTLHPVHLEHPPISAHANRPAETGRAFSLSSISTLATSLAPFIKSHPRVGSCISRNAFTGPWPCTVTLIFTYFHNFPSLSALYLCTSFARMPRLLRMRSHHLRNKLIYTSTICILTST